MTPKVRLSEAQIAAIQSLETETGRLTPRLVVEAARKKDSPLHALFNWDTREAAAKWWEQRAREILASVHYQYQTTEFSVRVPAYVVDTTTKGQGYRSTVALRDDQEAARESLIYTLETAAGHLRRALDLAGPLGLSGEVDALLETVAGVQRIVRSSKAA